MSPNVHSTWKHTNMRCKAGKHFDTSANLFAHHWRMQHATIHILSTLFILSDYYPHHLYPFVSFLCALSSCRVSSRCTSALALKTLVPRRLAICLKLSLLFTVSSGHPNFSTSTRIAASVGSPFRMNFSSSSTKSLDSLPGAAMAWESKGNCCGHHEFRGADNGKISGNRSHSANSILEVTSYGGSSANGTTQPG